MLALSPSAHVGSMNHDDMALIRHGKRHDAYAFILETLLLFMGLLVLMSGVSIPV